MPNDCADELMGELLDFERRERSDSEKADHARLRLRLLMEQSEYRWLELRGKILASCINLNSRHGSQLLRWDDKPNPLEICGKNETTLRAEYNRALRAVHFSGESTGREGRSYELTVRTVQGNDAVVWVEQETGRTRAAADITVSILRDFLRSMG